MKCNDCPRNCDTDRRGKEGVCGAGTFPRVAKVQLHRGEEPCLGNVSGAVFFSGCSLKCVFCQNWEISHGRKGKDISVSRLEEIFLELQDGGADNLDLVTPSHFAAPVAQALRNVKRELKIPVIWNSSAYEKTRTLERLKGLVDIYLPDLKYYDAKISAKYAAAPDYFERATEAVRWMRNAVSDEFDTDGRMKKGLLIRHLVLPTLTDQSKKILRFVREEIGSDTFVSVMGQYFPAYRAAEFPEIDRSVTRREYDRVLDFFSQIGLKNGYFQTLSKEEKIYVPEFDFGGVDHREEKT